MTEQSTIHYERTSPQVARITAEGGDGDDASAPWGAHVRQDRLGHPHDAVDVDVEDVLRPRTENSSAAPVAPTPALLTKTSMRSNRSITCSTTEATAPAVRLLVEE